MSAYIVKMMGKVRVHILSLVDNKFILLFNYIDDGVGNCVKNGKESFLITTVKASLIYGRLSYQKKFYKSRLILNYFHY